MAGQSHYVTFAMLRSPLDAVAPKIESGDSPNPPGVEKKINKATNSSGINFMIIKTGRSQSDIMTSNH